MADTINLSQILAVVTDLQASQQRLSQKVDLIQAETAHPHPHFHGRFSLRKDTDCHHDSGHSDSDGDSALSPILATELDHPQVYADKPILTTYPHGKGVKPAKMSWGEANPCARGPIIVCRDSKSMNIRNAIGAYGGPYSIYRGLAVAMGDLPYNHKPNFENTQPPIEIKQQPQWSDPSKIVSLDPFGHLTSRHFKTEIESGLDIRPTIAITRAHMLVPEIQEEVRHGRIRIDGRIVVNETGELNVHKGAIDPVWHIPGVADRLNVDETMLRRSLFENTGGMYPELMTRPDIKVFMPPIGGTSIYIFGDHTRLSDPNVRLTVRVHDECNGSDVFCSDICTCRPYLIFGITEAIKEAQNGGVGLIVYFRKEGRALGEVTKYLVYNARKREGDSAAEYFMRTENVAGVKDMRFQALMPDIFHWLGVTKIDRFTSMSNMKHDALVNAGIKILERVPIPDEMIPPDSKVEMEAKIASGYFTTGAVPREEDLCRTVGRGWEDFA
ncbi:GTP cyclohydrolase N terminal-domain-containing protein [Mortierella sp. GBAus27b]|nr:Uracil-regulated protein 1 [Mortierella sp. GBA43]KAI8361104.1 GTP cyclohydrolase N terminal-domain-containing protein [Mortierella sp. GBAus27b]